MPTPSPLHGGLVIGATIVVLGAASCIMDRPPPPEVKIYGVGDMPDDPPESCKFLEKIEVKQLEDKEPPIKKLEREARNADANAVAHIRREGFEDGFLGKEYKFRASLYECPVPKTASSGAASEGPPSDSASSAAPSASSASKPATAGPTSKPATTSKPAGPQSSPKK